MPVEQEPRSKVTFFYLFSFLTTFLLFWGQGMRDKPERVKRQVMEEEENYCPLLLLLLTVLYINK